jgi:hypothetical protein
MAGLQKFLDLGHRLPLYLLRGITLSVLVFLTARAAAPFFGGNSARTCVSIGLQWVLMTLLFEFL